MIPDHNRQSWHGGSGRALSCILLIATCFCLVPAGLFSADDDLVFATPTLIKILPEPVKRVMGDLSNKEMVLTHLGFGS